MLSRSKKFNSVDGRRDRLRPGGRGFEGACAQVEFLRYRAELEEFSYRKRKKREESPAFRGVVAYRSNHVLGIEPRQEKCDVAPVLTRCVVVSSNEMV